MSDCIRMNGEDWVRWSWYEQRGEELNESHAEIARLKAELAEAKADADLLGREVAAWRAVYKAWNEPGELHFREPIEFVADTDARPTAAARAKGTP